METNKRKGISLIVLVITIIVMIILATAIILSLSNSGIIGKANEARKKHDEAALLEQKNMDDINDILNGTELVYNKAAYDVKVSVWAYKYDGSLGDYNMDSPALATYIVYKNYKTGEKVPLLKDICDKLKIETQSNNAQSSGISTYEFPSLPSYSGKYKIFAIGQQVPNGTEEDYLIDTSNPREIVIKPHNGVYDTMPFYTAFGDIDIRWADSITGAVLLQNVIGSKKYMLLDTGFLSNKINLFNTGGVDTEIEIREDGVYDTNNAKLDLSGEEMNRNCTLRCIVDDDSISGIYSKMFDKRLGKNEESRRICYTIDDLNGNREVQSSVLSVPCPSGSLSVLSGFNINFSVPQTADKKYTMENCGIYIGGNYNINYAKKYITINDKEVLVNIPSVEDDITICLLSNQKFQ